MKWLDPVRPYLAAIKLAAFLLLILAAYLYGRADGKEAGRRAVEAVELKQAKAETETAKANQQAAQDAAERYRIKAESNEALANNYLGLLNDANRKGDKLASDLRTGDVRFRKLWAECQAVPAPGNPASGIGGVDAGTDDRAASAGRIVRAAAACDAQVRSLQAQVACDRGDKSKCLTTP